MIPADARAGLWWVTAAVAAVTCSMRPYARRTRHRRLRLERVGAVVTIHVDPPGQRRVYDPSSLGLGVLLLVPLFVVLSYGWAGLVWIVSSGQAGYSGAYYAASLYGGLVGIVAMASRFPSPPARIVPAVAPDLEL